MGDVTSSFAPEEREIRHTSYCTMDPNHVGACRPSAFYGDWDSKGVEENETRRYASGPSPNNLTATAAQDRITELSKIARLLLNELRDAIDSDANDSQLVELIANAFEDAYAIEVKYQGLPTERTSPPQYCRCNEYETCPVCIEAHRVFRAGQSRNSHD